MLLSRLLRLRTVGPYRKLGRTESVFLLGITQSSQRLPHPDVTQTSGIGMSPSSFLPEVRLSLKSELSLSFSSLFRRIDLAISASDSTESELDPYHLSDQSV